MARTFSNLFGILSLIFAALVLSLLYTTGSTQTVLAIATVCTGFWAILMFVAFVVTSTVEAR